MYYSGLLTYPKNLIRFGDRGQWLAGIGDKFEFRKKHIPDV